jgi:DNA-directed RNA polymerase specialized sigma24 family protein
MPLRARPDCLIEQGVATARSPMSEADLAAFYDEVFLPLVRRATWRYGLSKEDAKDVVQDAFLVAIEKIDSAKNPKAWLIQVVDHIALNQQRKLIRRLQLTAKWGSRGGTDQEPMDSWGPLE